MSLRHQIDSPTQVVQVVPEKKAAEKKASVWTDPKEVADPGSPLTWSWDEDETPIGAALAAELKGVE